MTILRRLQARTGNAAPATASHERLILVEMAGYYGLLGAAGIGAFFLR